MNIIKTMLFTVLALGITNVCNGQDVKPKFKEITFVAYRPNDSTKTLSVNIEIYYCIDSVGVIHVILNDRDNLKYTGFVRDTTYKLTANIINSINTIFNGQKKLASYMVIPKPIKHTSLLRPANFITYTANGVTDRIIFTQDFFGFDMNTVLNLIIFSKLARVKRNTGVYHNKGLESEILKYHLSCKCIPATDEPPRKKVLDTHE